MFENNSNMLYYIIGDYMKYKILSLLNKRKTFVSGQDIANALNVSRTAVWKHISNLKKEGYNIVAISNRGYKLDCDLDILNDEEINYRPVKYIQEVGSTNDVAKTLARENCDDKLLVVCDYQSSGKGRLGRKWMSEKGKGLYMSMVLRPDIMPVEAPQITLVAGMATALAINELTGLNANIKWPNDIIVNGSKIVGILTEMSAEMESVKYVVVGIGVNVDNEQFDDDIKNKASSLFLQTGQKYRRAEIADAIVTKFMYLYDKYCKFGFASLADEYNRLCINIGRDVRTTGKTQVQGKALGINENGELMIQTQDGIKTILSGEVSLRNINGEYI